MNNNFRKLSLLMVGFSLILSFFLRPENAGPFLLGFALFFYSRNCFCLSFKKVVLHYRRNFAEWSCFGILQPFGARNGDRRKVIFG